MPNERTRLHGYTGLTNNDGHIPSRWLDLPRSRTGLIVPKDPVVVVELGAFLATGGEDYIRYPADSGWDGLPLASSTTWFYTIRERWSKSWVESYADPSQLLAQFIGLKDANSDKVARFAQRWGPLWVCLHHQRQGEMCLFTPSTWYGIHKNRSCSWYPAEPVDMFRQLASKFYSVYNISDELRNGKIGPAADWINLGYGRPSEPEYQAEIQDIPMGWLRECITNQVNEWIALAGSPGLILDWYGVPGKYNEQLYKPRLAIMPGLGFFPLACLHLAQCVCGVRHLCFCTACNTLFDNGLKKPPRKNGGYCCPGCKKKASAREYAQRQATPCSKCGHIHTLTKSWEAKHGNVCRKCLDGE